MPGGCSTCAPWSAWPGCLLGSSPFTLVGDPASDSLLPIGELTLDDPAAEAPAGIGVLDSGPIASGNQVDAGIGDVSPSVPVMVCGNGVGVLGDSSASCGAGQQTSSDGTAQPSGGSSGSSSGDPSGNQGEVGVESLSPSVPVSACGDGVGLLGDAMVSCGADTSTGGIVAPPPGTTPARPTPPGPPAGPGRPAPPASPGRPPG